MQADDTQTSISLRNQISLYPKEGGAIVFVNDTGEYLQVNEIGRIILDGLMCGNSIEDCTNKSSPGTRIVSSPIWGSTCVYEHPFTAGSGHTRQLS